MYAPGLAAPMRLSRVLAVAGLALLLALPAVTSTTSAAGVAPTSAHPVTTARDSGPAPSTASRLGALNVTLASSLVRGAGGSPGAPTSALSVTPLPSPPSTTPTVLTFLTASPNCCVSANFSAPTGTWALVELRYNGQAVGGVYDSSFRAYLDQVQVLFGTTPEYGQWNVTQDVTPYVSLLNGTFNFTFLLGAATVGGYFLTSVSLWFYPVPAGGAAPLEPSVVVPLFHRVTVTSTSLSVSTIANVPTDVVNATLELWAYGFGADEFWYAQNPNFREMVVTVDGQGLAAVTPFPYINTGGNDPFAWRPITAVFTASDRPYDLNVTGALGLVEGTHNFSANLTGVTTGSDWLLGGALLLYTDPSVSAATLTARAFSVPRPTTTTGASTTQSETTSWSYESTWTSPGGVVDAATFGNSTFSSTSSTSSSWTNLSVVDGWSLHGHETAGANASDWRDRHAFRGSMDLGGTFVETSSTNGGYPIYGNFTDDFLNAVQEWNESTTLSTTVAAGPTTSLVRSVDNLVLGGNNIYSGKEELTAANAALLLAISQIESSTTDTFLASSHGGAVPYLYEHVVAGTAYDPAAPNDIETVYANVVTSPVGSLLVARPTVLDVNSTLALSAYAAGGSGPYAYTYTGLPTGCASTDVAAMRCRPTAPGLYLLALGVTDANGVSAPLSLAAVQVVDAPSISVRTNLSALETGATLSATATVSGGVAPYTCTWTVAGLAGSPGPCSGSVLATASGSSAVVLSVVVSDATGVSANATVSVPVVPPPTVSLWPAPAGNLTVGSAWTVLANVSGGVAPYTVTWYLNGVVETTGGNLSFRSVYATLGSVSVTASVTDALGGVGNSPPLGFNVTSAPSSSSGGAGPASSGTSSSTDLYVGLGLGAVAGLVLGVAVAWVLRRRRPG